MSKKVIIIGAGIGSLASALRLLYNGPNIIYSYTCSFSVVWTVALKGRYVFIC